MDGVRDEPGRPAAAGRLPGGSGARWCEAAVGIAVMTTSRLPPDHDARLERARLSLEGLSVGDAFGGRFFTPPGREPDRPAAGLVVLRRHRDGPCRRRAPRSPPPDRPRRTGAGASPDRYQADPYRGYGLSVRRVLEQIGEGEPWHVSARESLRRARARWATAGRCGSHRWGPTSPRTCGEVVEQARASAEVTHAHPEGQAGAIATAVAAAWAWNARERPGPERDGRCSKSVLDHTPEGEHQGGVGAGTVARPRTGRSRRRRRSWATGARSRRPGHGAVRPLVCRPAHRRLRRGAVGHRLGGRGQ